MRKGLQRPSSALISGSWSSDQVIDSYGGFLWEGVQDLYGTGLVGDFGTIPETSELLDLRHWGLGVVDGRTGGLSGLGGSLEEQIMSTGALECPEVAIEAPHLSPVQERDNSDWEWPNFPISAYLADKIQGSTDARDSGSNHDSTRARAGSSNNYSDTSYSKDNFIATPPQVAPAELILHASRPSAQTTSKRYPCPQADCNQAFISKRDAQRHVESVHEILRRPCPRCSKILRNRSDNFKRHLEKFCKKRQVTDAP